MTTSLKNLTLVCALVLLSLMVGFVGGLSLSQRRFVKSPELADKVGEIPASWKIFENKEYKVQFRYPPTLVREEPPYPPETLFTVYFIGQECASIPILERGHTPSLTFSVTSKETYLKPKEDLCSQELGPNCRDGDYIDPIPLNNGLQATLIRYFGVSGDGTSLIFTHNDLEYALSSNSGPVPCGEKNDYVEELFQIANTLTF